jgi:GTP cyclohydrolase II
VERAVADLRRGGIVVLAGDGGALLVQAAESATRPSLARLRALAGHTVSIAVTGRRAMVLGYVPDADGVVRIAFAGDIAAETVQALADPTSPVSATTPPPVTVEAVPRDSLASGAVDMAKLARLLPAAVIAAVPTARLGYLAAWANAEDLLLVELDDVRAYRTLAARALRKVGEAQVPLAEAEDARVIAFRPRDGAMEHVAVIIGNPDPAGDAVLTRLHSQCFTGDLLGSLRCDCGEQLRSAVATMRAQGGGVLLYLAQEGRGIGLANKLRAYALQDAGFDTVDANEQLGFDDDERVYMPAAEMLRQLGYTRVRLMTNNPAKVTALGRWGIEVKERIALTIPPNRHNARYLDTKRTRSGHLF